MLIGESSLSTVRLGVTILVAGGEDLRAYISNRLDASAQGLGQEPSTLRTKAAALVTACPVDAVLEDLRWNCHRQAPAPRFRRQPSAPD